MSDTTATGFKVGADVNPFEQAMRRMVDSSKTAQGQISGVFNQMNGHIKAAFAVLAGGSVLKESVEATQKFTGESIKLARVLGTTATEASTLTVALGDIYADTDTYTAAAGKLAKELRSNEGALQDMGLKTRDAHGALRPLKDLMMESIQVVNGYKQGIDRNIAAQQMWGKGAEEASALLKLNNKVMEEAAAKQRDLGLVIGQENVQASKAYKAAMNDAGDVMLALQKAVGDALLPVLTQLGVWLSDVGPAAVTVIKGAVGGLVAVFWGLKNAVQIAWEVIAGVIETMTVGLAGVGEGFYKILTGDLQGGVAAFRGATESIRETWTKRMGNMVDSSRDAQAKIVALFSGVTPVAQTKNEGKGATIKSGKDDSPLQAWEAELNLMKQALAAKNAAEGTFFEFSKERERAFWMAKRELAVAGTKEAYGVEAKITAATLDMQKNAFETRLAQIHKEQADAEQNYTLKAALVQRELALVTQRFGVESKQAEDAQRKVQEVERAARDQRKALRELEIGEVAANSEQRIELERQQQQLLLDMGIQTRLQNLAGEAEFENQRYNVQLSALQQRQALIDPLLNPVEYARIKAEILQLERQHQLEMGQIQSQQALERTTELRGMFGNVQSNWTTTINGMLAGTVTLGQGMRNMFKGVFDAGLGMLAQFVAKWMVQQLLMLVFGKTMAVSTVAEKAAEAGAGGVASMAAAPFPLNLSAPAFGAAMSAMAMSYAAVASASGGFDIPAGVNPLTQLHAEEMVLPSSIANPLRGMLSEGGGGGSGPMNVTIKGTPLKGNFFIVHRDDMVAAFKSAKRDFAFQG